jgi:HK97 family phage major capsid protein
MPKSNTHTHDRLADNLSEVRNYLVEERDRVLDLAAIDISMSRGGRSTADAVAIEEKLSEVSTLDLRIDQLDRHPARVTREPEVYRRGDVEQSFFRDVYDTRGPGQPMPGSRQAHAADRLERHRRMAAEKRAVDLNTTAGTGGEWAPPRWIVEDWINLARPGRVTADLIGARPLPAGVSSINIPKVTGATSTATYTQGTAASDTAATTSSVTSSTLSVAGKQTVSRQLVDQSGIPVDQFILSELALSYAATLNSQVITAAASAPWPGGGLLNVSGAGSITFTSAVAGSDRDRVVLHLRPAGLE